MFVLVTFIHFNVFLFIFLSIQCSFYLDNFASPEYFMSSNSRWSFSWNSNLNFIELLTKLFINWVVQNNLVTEIYKFIVGLHGDETYNTFCLWKHHVHTFKCPQTKSIITEIYVWKYVSYLFFLETDQHFFIVIFQLFQMFLSISLREKTLNDFLQTQKISFKLTFMG